MKTKGPVLTTNTLPHVVAFIEESNRIEGIKRKVLRKEIEEYEHFMQLETVTIKDLERFVEVHQPDAQLRNRKGLNVRVGNHVPPPGSPTVKLMLQDLLDLANKFRRPCFESIVTGKKTFDPFKEAYRVHVGYETLHPFTDCNGRSGRMLWMWMMEEAPLGFLHHWYYQSLDAARY